MAEEDVQLLVVLQEIITIIKTILFFVYFYQRHFAPQTRRRISAANRAPYTMIARLNRQLEHMSELINMTDQDCISQLRMDRNCFRRLCFILENVGGLNRTRHVQITEQVAIFLSILAHHKKNRVVKFDFKRSGYTISTHFNLLLQVVLRLYSILLVTPQPVSDESTDDRWRKWFKGCLGALDGTYIDVRVPLPHKARYRNMKGSVSVSVLCACDQSMNFSYVLSGWEGSAADCRVLHDVVTRSNGLKVPTGSYYLCDCGYTNNPGFLAPYRAVRYHLDEWGSGSSAPQNHKELFNLRHAKARNIIERAFCLLKGRWAILRSNAFYPIKTQNRIIMACCLLHNFIRTTMSYDPLEDEIPEFVVEEHPYAAYDDGDFVDQLESSQPWNSWRDNLAVSMYNEWRA